MQSNARAVIDLDVQGPVISRHLYGHFAEHLGRCIYGGFWVGEDSELPHIDGLRADVVEAMRALSVPNLRWPGGCFADEYHWRDGVGPRDQRPTMVNTHWGNVVEDNSFGTHEFMRLCEVLGADAYVNGNVGSGTVQEMSEWVEYLTRDGDSPMARLRRANGREEPWKVPFWGIGNEAFGCGGNMSPEYYAEEAKRYSTFCKNHGDNVLTRIAAGAPDDDIRWTEALMAAITCRGCTIKPEPVYQAISFHYYTHSGEGINAASATDFTPAQYYKTVAHALDIDRVIRVHSAVMDSHDPGRRIGLVCDEWGTWWSVEPGTNPGFLYQQNTMRDAIVAGLHFDIFHSHAERLRMANIAQTVNVLQAMILTTDDGGLVLTPTYHVFEMNAGHQDANRLPVHILDAPSVTSGDAEVPGLSMSASVRDGKALISLTHTRLEGPLGVAIDLRGREASVKRARVLKAPTVRDTNDHESPHRVEPQALKTTLKDGVLRVLLPRHSFATIELELGREAF